LVQLLARWRIKDYKNVTSPPVRRAYGILCGALGIGLNILLFAGKLLAGLFSGSIAITVDAFNNLSDAGSSLITMIGFKLAGQKPDPEHPFGHGRLEYVSGLVVALAIILMGVELSKTSVDKILHPEAVEFSLMVILILVISILVKVYMAYYNRKIGREIDSAAMRATAMDSLSDCLATGMVLLSMMVSHFSGWNIDGYAGILVAAFILYAGYRAGKETLSPLLGQPPDPEFVEQIRRMVLAHHEVRGIHDMVVHDYGPGRRIVSLHAEVPSTSDFVEIHETIDHIERRLSETLDCEAAIHMDPIVLDDERVNQMRLQMAALVCELDERLTIHDFRMVAGPTCTNVIFDVVVPFDLKMSEAQILEDLCGRIEKLEGGYRGVLQIDRAYV